MTVLIHAIVSLAVFYMTAFSVRFGWNVVARRYFNGHDGADLPNWLFWNFALPSIFGGAFGVGFLCFIWLEPLTP